MKSHTSILLSAMMIAVLSPASAQAQSVGILTPDAAGAATGSAYFPLQNAFDGQPTWSGSAPTGGGTGSDAPAYADRYGYIDFGPDYENVRITQTWTMYRTYSTGNQTPYANAWWDDDKDTTNYCGVVESTLNFNSAQGLSTGGTTPWVRDVDVSASPITPPRRYLILHSPNPMTNRAKEYAIVGYTVEGTLPPPVTGRPEMVDLIGVNIHAGAIYQNAPLPGTYSLYSPVTALLRDYHPMNWDVTDTSDSTNFPYDKWNWINWSTLYGQFTSRGFAINACVQVDQFGDGQWDDAADDAYAYGAAFASAFGPTYGSGVVSSVQIGNEPANMSDQLYITVFENMAEGIRDTDSALMIVTCNVQNSPSGTYHKSIDLFDGLEDLVDAYATHTYPMVTGWPDYTRSYPEDPDISYVVDVQRVIDWRDANDSTAEMWITEFGYDSSSETWSGNVTRTQQAQWLTRSFLVWSALDMDRAYMYYYNDDDTPSYHACSGLTVDYSPKPAYWAQKHLQETLGEYHFRQIICRDRGDLYVYAYEHESDPTDIIWVIWSPTGTDRTTQVTLDDLPGTPQWCERMPTADGDPPSVTWQTIDSDSISLLATESPAYLNMTVEEEEPEWQILTPAGRGTATGSAYCPATGAFNAQPTWDDEEGEPSGDDPVPHSGTDTGYANRYWYVDFGTNWADLRITQTWTRYRPYSGGNFPGFASMWWDDDKDTVNDNGVAENVLDFQTAQGVPNVGAQLWFQDVDRSSNPITPQRRYLLVGTGATTTSRPNEFIFVGYVVD